MAKRTLDESPNDQGAPNQAVLVSSDGSGEDHSRRERSEHSLLDSHIGVDTRSRQSLLQIAIDGSSELASIQKR